MMNRIGAFAALIIFPGQAVFDDFAMFPRVDLSKPLSTLVPEVLRAADLGGPGFFYLVNHGISSKVFDDVVRVGRRFFSQGQEKKDAVSAKGYGGGPKVTKGYVKPKMEGGYPKDAVDVRPEQEIATGLLNMRESFVFRYPEVDDLHNASYLHDYSAFLRSIDGEGIGSIDECRHFSHASNRVAPVDLISEASKRFFLPNQWPAESDVPQFRESVQTYLIEMKALSRKIFSLFAQALDALPESPDRNSRDFQSASQKVMRHEHGMMTANVARYPISDEEGMGIADHTDWEAFTLLYPAYVGAHHMDSNCSAGTASPVCSADLSLADNQSAATFTGLEVWFQDQWVRVPVIPGAVLVNQGEMLSRLSGGRFSAPVHRVQLKNARERMSLITFWALDFDVLLPDPDMPSGSVLAGEHYLKRNNII